MTTRSINDRMGINGYGSIGLYYNNPAGIPQGLVDPSGNIVSLPTLVSQDFTGWTRSSINAAGDASYTILKSVVIPAGTMGLNSMLRIVPEWDYPNSASTKTMSVVFGGTLLSAVGLSTGSVAGKIMIEIQNLNSLLVQKTYANNTYGVVNVARVSSSVDTSQDVTIDFEVKWSAATSSESLILLGYSIWHFPGV